LSGNTGQVSQDQSNSEYVSSRDVSTGSIGNSSFSIIKFKKLNNKWDYVNKWDDLEIGIYIRGYTKLPEIIQKGSFTFLELPNVVFYAAGTKNELTSIYNTKNFNLSLEIYSNSYNGLDDIDEFITSMNIDTYDKNGIPIGLSEENGYSVSNWNSSDYKIEYKKIENELFVYVYRTSAYFAEKKIKFVKKEAIEIYKYDDRTLKFNRVN
jgi:hypothetical protein